MLISAEEVRRIYLKHAQAAQDLVVHYAAAQSKLAGARTRVDQELTEARRAVAHAYLPELSVDAIARVARLTGFKGFHRRDPIKAMGFELATLQRTITQAEADPRYARREYLVGPVGEWTLELTERQSMLEPWARETARFEDLDGFFDLLRVGYDTPGFSASWWEADYWRYWAAGDRICAALELDDFGDDVLPAYQRVAVERDKWTAQVAEVQARIDALHQLVATRDRAEARIPQLPEIYLEQCVDVLGQFIAGADKELLEQWALADAELQADVASLHAIQQGLHKIAGLKAKARFLTELHDLGAKRAVDDFTARSAKYNRKAAKYGRAKYRGQDLPRQILDQKFEAKIGKYQSRAEQLGALADRLLAFDAYSRFDLSNDEHLWWLEFTGKRPGSYMPETRAWYDRHPDVAVEHDSWDDDDDDTTDAHAAAVAGAAVARDHDRYDYLS